MCEPVKVTTGAVVASAVGSVFSVAGLVFSGVGALVGVAGATGAAVCSLALAMYLVATSSMALALVLMVATAVCGIGTIVLLVKIVNRPKKQPKSRVLKAKAITRSPIKVIRVIEARPIPAIEAKPVLNIEPITQTAELINRKEAVNER